MIKNLYVIRNSGLCVYFLDFKDMEKKQKNSITIDQNLVSGFFTAILTFASEIYEDSNNKINKIALEHSNIYFIKRNDFHFIIETEMNTTKFKDEDYLLLLENIANTFELYMYRFEILQENIQIESNSSLEQEIKEQITLFVGNKINLSQYFALYGNNDNIADFTYVLDIKDKKLAKNGIISTSKREFHNFLKTRFFRNWQKKILHSMDNYGFLFYDDFLIVTINLYDNLMFTLGIKQDKLDYNLEFSNVPSFVNFIKGKVVSLGEQILS